LIEEIFGIGKKGDVVIEILPWRESAFLIFCHHSIHFFPDLFLIVFDFFTQGGTLCCIGEGLFFYREWMIIAPPEITKPGIYSYG
jgi:hypothetical protein